MIIEHLEVSRALELKNELLAAGLVMDQDFVWEWHPVRWDNFTGVEPSSVIFDFQDPAMATFYSLKWKA